MSGFPSSIILNSHNSCQTSLYLNNIMQCPICTLRYNSNPCIPVVLPCGHSYCQVCVKGFREKKCPMCCQQFLKYSQNYSLKEAVTAMYAQCKKVDYDALFKIIIVGESGVGKTSILTSFVKGQFKEKLVNTIGVDLFFCNETHSGKTYKFQMWDTGGQEKYRSITKNYFADSDLVILTYSLNSVRTFEEATDYWLEMAKQQVPGCKIVLIGNKLDELVLVTQEQIEEFKQRVPCISQKMSCKLNINVKQTWAKISSILIRDLGSKRISKMQSQASSIKKIQEIKPMQKRRCRC